ncbi:fungal-specific transcription factor domain-containing protein [Xylaria sp. CBS 124048]|nr:fungal-specific transcription factor domain-containing protein [Xylaria sp. CBS 124048]
MSATSAGPSRPKPPKVLACVQCQHRKIKCDRQKPCSNCVKAKVECVPGTPAPPHKRRRPNEALLDRLARCEGLLQKCAEVKPPIQQEHAPATARLLSATTDNIAHAAFSPTTRPDTPFDTPYIPAGKIFQEDGKVHFIDSCVLISLHEELAALRNLIDDDGGDQAAEPSSSIGLSVDNDAGMLLGVHDIDMDIHQLHPIPAHVLRLWQLFVDRVNPLTKVVHIPSLQPHVMDAAVDINNLSLPYQALLFSIYAMAIISTTGPECMHSFGMSREYALDRFTRGTKLALTRCNFLCNYDMTILQALTLYMVSLSDRVNNQSTWIMGGTVMRIAQKMGYHRDGEKLNLPPFETEMRRRLWWQVLSQDSNYATLAGLSQSWVPSNWDTKLPLNVEDEDLRCDSMEPLVSRECPTEMSFVLIIYSSLEFTIKIHRQFETAYMALRAGRSPSDAIRKYRALIDEMDLNLTAFERQYVDPTLNDVQLAASILRPMIVDRMRSLLILKIDQPEWGIEIISQIDSIFKSFFESHFKKATIFDRIANARFMWYVKSGLQPDFLLLFTVKFCNQTSGKLADDAWAALEALYNLHVELFDVSRKSIDRQAQFTVAVWSARERDLAQRGQQVEVPEFITRLRQLVLMRPSLVPPNLVSPNLVSPNLVSPTRRTSTARPLSLENPAQPIIPQFPSTSTSTSLYQPMTPNPGDFNMYPGNYFGMANNDMDGWENMCMADDAALGEYTAPYNVSTEFPRAGFSDMDFTE